MTKAVSYLLVSAIAWVAPAIVSAHPGHGLDGGSFSLLHYLTEPEHVGIGLAVILLVAAGVYWSVRTVASV